MPEDYKDQVLHASTRAAQMTLKAMLILMQALVRKYKQNVNINVASKGNRQATPHGKITLQELNDQGKKLENIDVNKGDLGILKKEMGKLSVDFSVLKEKGTDVHHVYFKGQDAERIHTALEKCLALNLDRNKSKKPMEERFKEAKIKATERNSERAQSQNKYQEQSR